MFLKNHPNYFAFFQQHRGYLPLIGMFILTLLAAVVAPEAFGQARIPGTDESSKLEAAGTLLRILDTSIFVWGARLCAGIMIFSAGLNLKEQRFGIAIICIIGALVIGTAPMWVKNIFEIGGGSVFSSINSGGGFENYA